MVRENAIGIDLGTTYSAVAWVDESGRSAMLRNAEGDLLTPSVVLFGDQEVVVGKAARRAATVHPGRVARWVKRDMGSPAYCRPICGKYLPPEVIQACILRKLRADVVDIVGPEAKVVITVPAYFDEPRRKATADAGEMAGLRVLDIVNEPTAAALAFGEALGYLSPSGAAKEKMTVFVYDLGGGTFDATLLWLASGDIRTIATDGDVQLGGYDWDRRLVDYVAEEFEKSHQLDLRQNSVGMNRLLDAVIEAKHTLSARSRTTVRVEHDGRTFESDVDREQFEELTADLLERTAYTIRQLLADGRLQWKDVSRVLLVGGSTRMPMVSEMLREMTGISPDRTVNPDEAVARGAALYAAYLLAKQGGEGSSATFKVTNVNAHSLGVEGIDQQTLRKTNVVLIPRNTPLPATHTERFVTKSEGQRSIVVQILEGESSLPGECTAIGRTVVRDLPDGLPKGWPIEVSFKYGANGRLGVQAVVPGTHQDASLDLQRTTGLSGEKIDRGKQSVGSSAGFDAFESMVLDVLAAPEQEALAAPDQPASPEDDHSQEAAPPDWPAEISKPADANTRPAAARGTQTRRWVILVVGYLSSAIIGLGLGWLVLWSLSRWWPSVFRVPW
jgi:molecular chaperone DnaK